MATYGARTGVTTLIFLVDKLCRLYVRFSKYINPWIVDQIPTGSQGVVFQFLDLLQTVCVILNSANDD